MLKLSVLNLRFSLLLLFYIIASCHTGKLLVIASMPSELSEISAVETLPNSDLIWVIEDAGNDNHLYGLNLKGTIIQDYVIENAENNDWEDLTSDTLGNIYIGDFGNNSRKRKEFKILKVSPNSNSNRLQAEVISFKLPKGIKSKDFEAFFLFEDNFYIFSKENSSFLTIKVPNKIGNYEAEIIAKHTFKGKHTKITSAAISTNGNFIYLLNHDKVWELSNFSLNGIFEGNVKAYEFDYNSQNEGLCIKNDSTLYITDERNKSHGGNLYAFKIN